mmetsp:Transcript_3229/g.9901  ORF Transcript_3229/g.9901 Transcript_3229/m.9901 type:complete len:447 (+) Transcript_3229:1217-2557(+)
MPWGCIRESLDGTSFASWANNRGFASASPDAAKAQATLESPWSEKSAQSSRRDAFAKSARWSDGAPGVPHAPLRRSSLCTPSASMPSALRRVRAAVATAHATLPTSCGLNWSSRRADSSTTASNRPGAWTSAVAKAQAVFARFCAMKRSTRGAAVFATAAKSSGASYSAVANAQTVFPSSCGLNSSIRAAEYAAKRSNAAFLTAGVPPPSLANAQTVLAMFWGCARASAMAITAAFAAPSQNASGARYADVAIAQQTLAISCGLNSFSGKNSTHWREIASKRSVDADAHRRSRASPPSRGSSPNAGPSRFAKAQARFASSCGENVVARGVAESAMAAKSSGASKFAVAKAQATFVSSWALNSSARGADSSPMRTMHRVAASARRISTGPRRWKRAFATRRGCNNLAAPHAALASARASQDEPPSSSSRDRARSSKAARRSASPEPA